LNFLGFVGWSLASDRSSTCEGQVGHTSACSRSRPINQRATTLDHQTYGSGGARQGGGLLGRTIHSSSGDGALAVALLDFLSEGLGRATTAQQRSRGDGRGGLHVRTDDSNEHAQDWHAHVGGEMLDRQLPSVHNGRRVARVALCSTEGGWWDHL
jgi:hypothetical protein